MANISDAEIDAVRSRVDIVEVIGHYLPVEKRGKSYVALCPFHPDHDPSMTISPDKQIFKCFVCGAGGGVFRFVQEYEKVSFPEAVGKVAELVGYPLSVNIARTEKPKDPHKEKLYKVLDETIRYSMYQMNTDIGTVYKEYCDKRGLTQPIREQFQIGYNPPSDSLYRFLSAKGFDDQDIVSCNVARISTTGIHDVFSDRIMFPIHDENGKPIGFSARTIDPENPSKYINTNDTDLFHKGDIVYNLHRARLSARREGKIYICEGVTDVIAFYQAGIENSVCTLGTSCTDHQLKLLKGASPKLVFCYDGDAAGQAATWRGCKMAQKIGAQVAVVRNRTGLDPDEIIRKEGGEALKTMVQEEISWIEFAIDYLKDQTNFTNYESRKEFAKKAQEEIALLSDELDKQHFTEVVSELSGFRLEYRKETTKPEVGYIRQTIVRTPDGKQQAEEWILAQMLAYPEAIQDFVKKMGYLTDPTMNAAAMMIVDAYRKNGTVDAVSLLDRCDNPKIQDLFSRLITSWVYELPYDERVMDGAYRKIRISVTEAKAEAFAQQLKQPMNPETQGVLLNEYQECLKELRRYIDEENSREC